MAWSFDPSGWSNGVTIPHVSDFQHVAADVHTWGGNVDAGGYNLANVANFYAANTIVSGLVQTNGSFRASGNATPSTGSGVEVAYIAGVGYITCYDRSGAVYKPLSLGCLTLSVPYLPTTAPAGGSKQLWADPSDSYRVKFAV